MENKIKVVCPKCQAKLNLAVEKMKSEVVKFRCPGCSTVLKVKKPSRQTPEEHRNTSGFKEDMQKRAGAFDRDIEPAIGQQEDFGDEELIPNSADNESIEDILRQGKDTMRHIPRTEHVSPDNMRRHKRVKFKKKVLVDNQIMVEALDISESGLFLHTGRSFEDGSTVQLGIPSMTGKFDLVVNATVQHNHKGIGMGLQFVEVNEATRNKLLALINSLDEEARKELEGRKVILLAGGSDQARNINKSKLVLDGFYVLQATNADEVFDILKNETPDAMVLDWQETSFYSKGLLNQIRKTPQYDNVIIIVLATLTDAYAEREILDAGADRYMAKMDTNPAKLSQALSELIEKRDG
ncbi:MAG: PilZ domain-containing protein [Deltaproteobacteria bacterium]|jgi:CheY-like chemotaxis protein|nr:PilZ domain-containing protein [Deltaproteobacteria bacterium]